MSSPSFSIRPVESSDIPTLGDWLAASKLALTINRLIFKDWPNEATQKPIYMDSVAGALKDATIESLKVVDDESGDILGYLALSRKRLAKIELSTDEANEDNEDEKQSVSSALVPDVYEAVMKAVTELVKETEEIDHYGE